MFLTGNSINLSGNSINLTGNSNNLTRNSITLTGSVMSDRKQYYYLGSGVSAHRLEQRESTRLAAGQCAEVRGRARTRSEAGVSRVISSSLGLRRGWQVCSRGWREPRSPRGDRRSVVSLNTSSLTRSQVHSGTRSVKENVVDCDCQQLTLIFLPGRNLCAEGGMV